MRFVMLKGRMIKKWRKTTRKRMMTKRRTRRKIKGGGRLCRRRRDNDKQKEYEEEEEEEVEGEAQKVYKTMTMSTAAARGGAAPITVLYEGYKRTVGRTVDPLDSLDTSSKGSVCTGERQLHGGNELMKHVRMSAECRQTLQNNRTTRDTETEKNGHRNK